MPDPTSTYEIQFQAALDLQRYTLSFTLSPTLWLALDLPQPLTWHRIRFDESFVNQVPNNLSGVYSFVVEPGIANHNPAYLLYIGLAAKQSFRARYRQYLRHQVEERTRRPLVRHMVRAWSDHLWFYYAPVEGVETVKETESKLLSAFKPPIPRAFSAELREPISLQSLW